MSEFKIGEKKAQNGDMQPPLTDKKVQCVKLTPSKQTTKWSVLCNSHQSTHCRSFSASFL